MARVPLCAALSALLACAFPARAAVIDVAVADSTGHPAANAVVSLVREDGAMPASQLPEEAMIDQRHETFIPLVTILRHGGRVIFTNHDTTMHQVYSFSPPKQFAFEVDEGRRSEPVVFDKPGIVSIGCNIHDQMIAYVFVAATPWAAMSDAEGHARFADVPAGKYRAEVWHPQLLPGRPPPAAALNVSGDSSLTLAIPLLAKAPVRHMHMGAY